MSRKKRIYGIGSVSTKLTSTISITMVLVLIGLTLIFVYLGKELSVFVKENVSFSVMFNENTTDAQIEQLKKEIDAQPFVKSSRYISKEEAKQQLIKDLGEDPEELLGYNPALNCLEINLHSEYTNTDSLKGVTKIIKQQNNVEDLLFQQEYLNLINNNISRITIIILIITAGLLLISFTLIKNTIRLSIYSKRFSINTMKLVGATGGFIRKPFLINNILIGIAAGVVADGIIFAALYYMLMWYPELNPIINEYNIIIAFITIIIIGVIITTFSTIVTANKYLRMKSDKLYHI